MMLTSISAGLSDLESAAEFAKHPSERRFSEEALGSQNQAAFRTDPWPCLGPPARLPALTGFPTPGAPRA